MDIHLRLFSDRLRRLLDGEEGMLPDPAKQHIQNLQTEVEIVASWLRDYEWDIAWLLVQKMKEEHQIDSPDLEAITEEINCFARESDKVIDTFIIFINQQNSQSCSEDIRDALLGLQSKIFDIKTRMQQVQHIPTHFTDEIKSIQAGTGNSPTSSSFKKMDTVGLDDRMEELLDLLIEGPPQLSIVAILDSLGVGNTAFAAEAYNSNYVKHYFDYHAWVPATAFFDSDKILDGIMNSVVPLAKLSEVMHNNYEMKKIILHNYLMNKRYLIVLDDVWDNLEWDAIWEILPDDQNGSRVLSVFTNAEILTSFQLANGEKIGLDFVPAGGPFRVTYGGWPILVVYHGSMSLQERLDRTRQSYRLRLYEYFRLPLYLKHCCLYLSAFHENLEITTKQLCQLWIAEGFIPDNSEATAKEYLEELIDRDYIQVRKRSPAGTIKTCSTVGRSWTLLVLISDTINFTNPVFGDEWVNSRKTVKRLATYANLDVLNLLVDFDSCLHSLLYVSSKSDYLDSKDCENIWKMCKFLRVLDLGSLVLNQYPSGIENLFLLRYLKLDIPSLKSLPSSLLCSLLNLYTLDMPSSYIDHTADDIWEMNKLRYLNFRLIKLPVYSGKYFSSLESLNFISALHPCCCTPDILGSLPNLQNLRICGDLSNYQDLLSKNLCNLSCLESLKLVNECKMSRLSKIVLAEYQLPPGLTQLSFSNTELKDDPMPTLEKLPRLQVLKLKQNSYLGRKLVCGSNGFPELKILHMKSMLWLEEWAMENGAMPKLECLVINPCAYLKKLPEQLWYMKSFNKLELWWPQPELRQKLRDFEDKEQYDIQIYPKGM